MANRIYAVRKGRVPGIYHTWEECKAQVHGYSGSEYKSFLHENEAISYVNCSPAYEKCPNEFDAYDSEVIAYTDGSYHSQKGFSYGVVIIKDNEVIHTISNKFKDTILDSFQNTAGEMMGAIAAMNWCADQGYGSMTLYYDYEGVAAWCTGAWRPKVPASIAYTKRYFDVKDRIKVNFVHVRGHSGDKFNNMADALAREALGLGKR